MSFTVYSKPGCPFCDKVKVVLSEIAPKNGHHLTSYELDVDFTRDEFYSQFGEGSTFPQVVFGEEHLGGCTDTIKYLQENNML